MYSYTWDRCCRMLNVSTQSYVAQCIYVYLFSTLYWLLGCTKTFENDNATVKGKKRKNMHAASRKHSIQPLSDSCFLYALYNDLKFHFENFILNDVFCFIQDVLGFACVLQKLNEKRRKAYNTRVHACRLICTYYVQRERLNSCVCTLVFVPMLHICYRFHISRTCMVNGDVTKRSRICEQRARPILYW